MDNGEKKQIIENTPRVDVGKILNDPPAQEPMKVPPGCVERVLSFRERNFIVGACRALCEKIEHKSFKDQANLARLNKILLFDETLEYFAMLEDAQEELTRKWTRDKKMYKLWRNFQEGLIKVDEFKKEFPDVDPNEEVKKPSLRTPENTKEEMRGKERAFYLPAKLDVWVQTALRAMEWTWQSAEYSVDLCEKFGIKDEAVG